MSKIVYKASSNYLFVGSIFWRAVCIALIIYSCFHYEQNPVAVIIVSVIFFSIFFFIGDEIIIVYTDKIVLHSSSIANLFLKSPAYLIKDIESAEIPPPDKLDVAKITWMAILIVFLPKQQSIERYRGRIYLILKNDEIITIKSDLDRQRLMKVVRAINEIILKRP